MLKYEVVGNENYSAQCIRVERLIDLEGLDNLRGLPWAGYTALVPKDIGVGDLVVVFPAEAQLERWVCAGQNLYAQRNKNIDTTVKGYLGNNGRVRAIRLRGHTSSALVLPAYAFGNPPEGTVFDTLDGTRVCQKYVLPHKESRNTGKKDKNKKRNIPFFPIHYDTAQYFRHQDDIGEEEYVVVTQKLHGCFHANTSVLMWDGTRKRITQVVEGDELVGVDDNGMPTRAVAIRDAFTTGTASEWLRTSVKNVHKGQNPVVTSTPEHQIYTPTGEYVEAQKLSSGDLVVGIIREPVLTEPKSDVLIGLMLGDGSIAGRSVEWSHKEDHADYLEYIKGILGNIAGTGDMQHRVSGYGTRMLGARTRALTGIERFVDPWRNNMVPEDLELSPLSIAIWYMDDGSLAHHESQQDRACFAICSFDDTGAETIQQSMRRYGFDNPVVYKSNGYNRLRLNKDDADKLFHDIAPFVPPVMQYKLPSKYRGLFVGVDTIDEEAYMTVPVPVLSQASAESKDFGYSTKWDIETTTHNFVANNVVVHNSSVRFGRVNVERKLSWIERLAKRLGVRVDEWEKELVVGSRKVIKGEASNENYYDSDIWTEVARPYADLIPDNVMVFGEIIGWVGDAPIQMGYTYGIPKGEHELYVYRVAVVADDGAVYDLPWDGVVEFCNNRGMQHVVELAWGTHAELRERYHDMADFMDQDFHNGWNPSAVPLADESPVDEGVVIRWDGGITPTALKIKGPIFYRHETGILDQEVEDIEEEN